jgi:hypothetical protein
VAFEGNDDSWLYFRKSIEWKNDNPHVQEPKPLKITSKANLKKTAKPQSPIVVSMTLNGTSICFSVHKTSSPMTRPLLTNETQKGTYSIKNANIPSPANATWTTHPQYQKGRKVSNLALAYNNVNVTIDVELSNNLAIGWIAVQNPAGGSVVGPFDSTVRSIPGGLPLDEMKRAYPNTSIAKLIEWAASQGYVTFDPPTSASGFAKKYSSQPASLFSTNTEGTVNASSHKFIAPEGFELPDLPPGGYSWDSNIRGVVILRIGDKYVWPHEVWRLDEMHRDVASIERSIAVESVERKRSELIAMKDSLDEQIDRVQALFSYEEEVGNGIALQARIFNQKEIF